MLYIQCDYHVHPEAPVWPDCVRDQPSLVSLSRGNQSIRSRDNFLSWNINILQFPDSGRISIV